MEHDHQSMALWLWNFVLPMEVRCCWTLQRSLIAVLRWFGVNRRERTCAWSCFLRDSWHRRAATQLMLIIQNGNTCSLPLMAYSNHTWRFLHDDSYKDTHRLAHCTLIKFTMFIYNLGSFLRSISPLCFSKKSSTWSCLTLVGLISTEPVPLTTCCCWGSWGST